MFSSLAILLGERVARLTYRARGAMSFNLEARRLTVRLCTLRI